MGAFDYENFLHFPRVEPREMHVLQHLFPAECTPISGTSIVYKTDLVLTINPSNSH